MQENPPSCSQVDGTAKEANVHYANQHIPSFLKLPLANVSSEHVQRIDDGSLLSLQNIISGKLSIKKPIIVQDTPESIGMKLPSPRKSSPKKKKHEPKHITVRDIADIVGYATPLHVIDVEFQEELEGWTFADLVDYFEDESRVSMVVSSPTNSDAPNAGKEGPSTEAISPRRQRLPRKAAALFLDKTRHRVINQISFEFSRTPLASQVLSPQVVREVDWIDLAWPKDLREKWTYPIVQYYCLTSAAGAYTDFHVDFGGSSVWYHILFGAKEFCLIPPSAKNLEIYEEWLCREDQMHVFLPDLIADKSQVLRIVLQQSQTMIIPSGWIHAVYTPADSVVFGGNFLHGLDMNLQLQVYAIEVRSSVLHRFRFPFFKATQFYAAGMYLEKLRRGDVIPEEIDQLSYLLQALREWSNPKADEEEPEVVETEPGTTAADAAVYASKQNSCADVAKFLRTFQSELNQVVRAGLSSLKKAVNSRSKPIPKLRLKLGSPSKVENAVQTQQSEGVNASADASSPRDGFRIRLSTSSRQVKPVPQGIRVARSKPREDLSSFVDEREVLKDDEWVPSSSSTGKSRTTTTKTRANTTSPSGKKKRSPAAGPQKAVKKAKPTTITTARQRLLKKVG